MGVLTHSLCIAVLYYAAFSGTSAQLQTSFVCEGKTLTIECPSGTTIDVEDALYGRDRGPSVCNHRSIRVTSGCKASTSLSRVRDACQGETSCQISASNRVFGDPCVGTYKFLRVEYKCISTELQTSLVCEGKTLTIECPSGTYIDVEYALYGRDRGPSVCNHPSIRVTSCCQSSTSLSRVWNACQGETSCQISASNHVFGDPCVNTYKFLRVEYKCRSVRRARVCESGNLSLHCPYGQVLNIVGASYGRNAGSEVCPSPSIRQISNCRAASSSHVVSSACNGKNACHVSANNGVFGDPCVGTYKYLEVEYSCN
ncbi:L-rhamnose-binding lectin CSL3-like [Apostichopus japonicus]|uniref:L-rhamnose-binding lectin CSL3-like n=1 Tax=Stichopus japonicus TaxID=307972 RepID=UPI003AB228FC